MSSKTTLWDLFGTTLQSEPTSHDAVREADLAPLPEPARRYLRAMGVVGHSRDRSFRLEWKGRFRPRVGSPWFRCDAQQFNSGPGIQRDFRMQLWAAGLLPLYGRDTYAHGQGRMEVRAFDVFPVAKAHGRELDLNELVTWLDDAVMFAPSMLLVPAVEWLAVDADTFDVVLRDHGLRVTGRVSVDARGALREFVTHDRWCENPVDRRRLIRAMWRTPVDARGVVVERSVPVTARAMWTMPVDARGVVVERSVPIAARATWRTPEDAQGVFVERSVPVAARAIWSLPGGEFTYADLKVVPGSLAWNIPCED